MGLKQDTSAVPNALLRLALLCVLAGLGAGCQTGRVQLAFYTDKGHFPSRGCEDDVLFLFRGSEYLYMDWLDVPVLRMRVTAARGKTHPLLDPTDTLRTAEFDMEVECLAGGKGQWKQCASFTAREHEITSEKMPGVGTIEVRMDDTQYGLARLDRLRIDFEADFLAKARSLAATQVERLNDPKLGRCWRFLKRNTVSVGKPIRKRVGVRYSYKAEKRFPPDPKTNPYLEITVKMQEEYVTKTPMTVEEAWEYWPVDPRRFGAVPMCLKPLKVERCPTRVLHQEDSKKRLDPPDKPRPAANVTVLFHFEYPNAPAGWVKPGFLRDRTAITDGNGVATLDLWPIVPATNICDKLVVHYRAQDDHARPSPGSNEITILRSELRPWWQRWQREHAKQP